MNSHHKLTSAAFLASTALTGATPALAQSPVLEEVIVTATKRAESLQDVPVSVSVLSGNDLDALGFRDTTEIAQQVPNLQASAIAGEGMPIFALRGVSMNDFSFNQNSPVGVYIDEVYKGNPALQGVQIYDLERIEVLRGPQGTLYGKNTTGGAVNFITQKPVQDTEAYLTLGAGNFDRREAKGALNLELGSQAAVRLAGTWVEADGWQDNVSPGVDDGSAVDDYGLRLGLYWTPADELEVLLRASTSKANGVNYGIVGDEFGEGGIGAGVYGLYNAFGATDRTDSTRDGLDLWEFESEQDEKRKVENDAISLTVNWGFSDSYTLTSITSWDEGENFVPEDADGTFNTLVNAYQSSDVDQFAQDLRVTSDFDGPFNFIAGLYYSEEEVDVQTTLMYAQDLDINIDGNLDFTDCSDPLFLAVGAPELVTEAGLATDALFQETIGVGLAAFNGYGCQTQNDFTQTRESAAAYFDGSYHLTDNWTFRLGLRYTEDKTELSDFSARYLGSDNVPILATIPLNFEDPYATLPDDDFTDDEVTGQVGLDYSFDNGTLVYGKFSHGYRSGAYNAQAFNDPSEVTKVDPELIDAFELGFKSTLADGRVQLNGAAFFYAYENQQFLNIDENLIQTLVNIDESEIYGMELELVASPHDSWLVQAGLGLLESEVTDGMLSGQDLKGNELPQAPGVNFNYAIDWDALETDAGTLTLRVDGSYVDSQYFEVANVPSTEADSYWLVNGRVSFESAEGGFAVSVWGKNLTEEEYVTSTLDLQGFFGFNYNHVGAPRTYGVDVTFRY